MTTLTINEFRGEAPSRGAMLLENSQARIARNCKLPSGELRPFRKPSEAAALAPGGAPAAIHYYAGRHWLAFTREVDVVRGPVAGDVWQRSYVTGLEAPMVIDAWSMALGQSAMDELQGTRLGVPAPEQAPLVALGPETGGILASRAYVQTFVNGYGEEGPPSPPTRPVDVRQGQAVILRELEEPPAVSEGPAWNIVSRRIYRTDAPTSGSALWRFVAELPVGLAGHTDTMEDVDLGESLASATWDPPPHDLAGLVVLPGGALAGFSGNQVCFSEPYRPHAWPPQYRLATDYDVVALGVSGSTLVAATRGHPYLVSGTDPASMSMTRLPDLQPCVARLGMTGGELGVVYPTPDGLYAAGGRGAQMLTAGLFGRDEWQALNPETMRAAVHDGKYFAFFEAGTEDAPTGLVLDPSDPAAGLVFLDREALALATDPETDRLYLATEQDGGHVVVEWEGGEGVLSSTWRSKTFALAAPQGFGAVRVEADFAPVLSDTEQQALEDERQAVLDQNAQRVAQAGSLEGELAGAAVGALALNGDVLQAVPKAYEEPQPVRVRVLADDVERGRVLARSHAPLRVPSGWAARSVALEVETDVPVRRVTMAPSVGELAL
jgi:hypothetical protein